MQNNPLSHTIESYSSQEIAKQSRILNFSAGPAALPLPVLECIEQELFNYHNTGMSMMEISHRAEEILDLIEQSTRLVKKLLGLNHDYEVIFMQGGGSLQFQMVPMNFSLEGEKVDYIDTGYWASKAIKEAQILKRDVTVIASSEKYQHTAVVDIDTLTTRHNAQYLHFCSNNTVVGTQFHQYPKVSAPLIADMSSDFLSKPFDITPFTCVYAHAQKNIGISGVTVIILKKNQLNNIPDDLPTLMNYHTHIQYKSNYQTPPCFALYVTYLTLKWLDQEIGGVQSMDIINQEKSSLLYQLIDNSNFYNCPVEDGSRSKLNVVFLLPSKTLEHDFIKAAKQSGIVGINGHRSVGGCRVSLYNAVSLEQTQQLIVFMKNFAKKNR